MDYLISVSHSDFVRFRGNIDKVAEICSISGFPGIEGHHSLFEGLSNSELEESGEILRDNNIKYPTFHLPCSLSEKLDLASSDADNGKTAVKIYSSWMEKAALIGFKTVIIHGTTQLSSTEYVPFEEYFERFSPRFEIILQTAERFGLSLALENQNPTVAGRFSSRAEHLYSVLKRFESHSFGFCLDFGHAYIGYGNDFSDLYEVMKDRIKAVHLHGNYGKEDIHLPPGYGNIDWKEVKKYLYKINLPYICIESSPHPSIDHFLPSDWKKLYIEACEILA